MTNVITSAFDAVSTVDSGVELVEAFDTIAVRDSMRQVRRVSHRIFMTALHFRTNYPGGWGGVGWWLT